MSKIIKQKNPMDENFKSRYSLKFRAISALIICSFLAQDVARAEDFRLQREKQKDSGFLPEER